MLPSGDVPLILARETSASAAAWPSAWADREELRLFRRLEPVATGEGLGCDETLALLEEVAALSQRLELALDPRPGPAWPPSWV